MERQAHYLKTVKGGTLPRSILCVGVSGVPGVGGAWSTSHIAYPGCEIADGESANGGCRESFWAWLQYVSRAAPGSLVVFLGAVDCLTSLGFWDLLEDDKWTLSETDEKDYVHDKANRRGGFRGLAVLEDPPTIVVVKSAVTGHTVKIIDVRNYGVSTLADCYIGPMPCGDNLLAAKVAASAIAATMRQIVDVVSSNRLGSLKTTAASQAMHAYRYRFLRSIILCHDNLPALGLERNTMYAGRCEAWHVGKVPRGVYNLDFKAHYPAAVIGQPIPARLRGFVLGCEPSPVELMKRGFLCISEVTLDTAENNYPVRFSSARHARAGLSTDRRTGNVLAKDGDLVYPVGRFATALCGPELSIAFSRGHVSRIHSTAWYEPSELFTQWACELGIIEEQAKQTCLPGVRAFVKRMRNSLFGKFGQWDWRWIDAPNTFARMPYDTWYGPNPDGGPAIRYRSIGWSAQMERKLGESQESCPAIAAWVYSLARVRLLMAIECAGRDNVYYMDADSIWCNHDGFRRLEEQGWINPNLPGKLVIKGMHESLTIYGLKQYVCDGKQIHAGVPNATPGSHLQGWMYRGKEKLGQSLPHGRAPGQEPISYSVRPSMVYRHGIVDVSGRVMPYVLREE